MILVLSVIWKKRPNDVLCYDHTLKFAIAAFQSKELLLFSVFGNTTTAIIIIAMIITTAIVLVSSVAFGTFSFEVRTSSSSIDGKSTTRSIPSQITSKSGMDLCSSRKTVDYLWDHVYAVNNGNPNVVGIPAS
jgi:hypothetical protein